MEIKSQTCDLCSVLIKISGVLCARACTRFEALLCNILGEECEGNFKVKDIDTGPVRAQNYGSLSTIRSKLKLSISIIGYNIF